MVINSQSSFSNNSIVSTNETQGLVTSNDPIKGEQFFFFFSTVEKDVINTNLKFYISIDSVLSMRHIYSQACVWAQPYSPTRNFISVILEYLSPIFILSWNQTVSFMGPVLDLPNHIHIHSFRMPKVYNQHLMFDSPLLVLSKVHKVINTFGERHTSPFISITSSRHLVYPQIFTSVFHHTSWIVISSLL